MHVCVCYCMLQRGRWGAVDACGREGGYGLADAMTKKFATGCHLIYSNCFAKSLRKLVTKTDKNNKY